MHYLYYTIYIFYKKIIRIEYWGDKPFFYCNIVLALFESFFIFSLLNLYLLYLYGGMFINYSKWWFYAIGMILFLFNSYYYKRRESNILKEMSIKSKENKTIIFICSFLLFLLITWSFFHTGTLVRMNNGFSTNL